MGALVQNGCELWVHLDHQVLLLLDLLVPLLALLIHPVLEGLADQSVYDGGDVVSVQLHDVDLVNGQGPRHIFVAG